MNNLTQGLLASGNEVRVLAMNTPKSIINTNDLEDDYRKKTQIEAVFVNTSIKVVDAVLNLFSDQSYNIQRFISSQFKNHLKEILENQEFDIIQLESLFLTPYLKTIRDNSTAKVVLRAHNVEFEIWKRRMMVCTNPIKKAYLKLLTERLRKFELEHINSYDGIAAITNRDAEQFKSYGCNIPITDIPVGVDFFEDTALHSNIGSADNLSLFHLGSMDWMPNQEAIRWFLNNTWDEIHAAFPGLKLFLAGKNMPNWLQSISDRNIEVEGEIKDAKSYMLSKGIMIVPLLSGSGMRVKIIEGMALGKVIISTTIGAEGINYTNDKDILIADTPQEFLEAVTKCTNDTELYGNIGLNAIELVKEQYDNIVIAKKLENFYAQL